MKHSVLIDMNLENDYGGVYFTHALSIET